MEICQKSQIKTVLKGVSVLKHQISMVKTTGEYSVSFYLVEKLSSQEKLFYKQKISVKELEETVNEIRSYLTSLNNRTRGSHEEECGIALYILLERIRASIELEKTILEILSTQTDFFDSCLDTIVDRIDTLLRSDLNEDADRIFNFEEREFKTSKLMKQKRTNYPKKVSKILRGWLVANMVNPYPSEAEKTALAKKTGLDQTQINNWFINARRRILPLLKQKANKR